MKLLLLKASGSPNYEEEEKINRTIKLYRQNPQFTYRNNDDIQSSTSAIKTGCLKKAL